MSIPKIEILFLIAGHIFNRFYCILSLFVSAAIAYFNSDMIIEMININTMSKIKEGEDTKMLIAIGFFLFNLVLMIVVLMTTQTLKRLIKRKRPLTYEEVVRMINLSDREVGTLSMPSGDTA